MRKLVTLSMLFVLLFAGAAMSERVMVGATASSVDAAVQSSSSSRTVLTFDLGNFDRKAVSINGTDYYLISCEGEANCLEEGRPDLPHVSRSIIIPDDAEMKIKILDAEYVDYENTPVAPSKGNLVRTVNPDDVPYTFGAEYSLNEFYPAEVATLREPFIMRDYRGVTIDFNAFQYNPAKQTLRVYKSVTVEVTTDGPGKTNVLNNSFSVKKPVPDFEMMYHRRFLNYDQARKAYPSVPEAGDMLIICYADWLDEMQPLVDWKMQKGMKTTLVSVASIGNNATSIKNFIQAFYDSTNLAYVLLVGDHNYVATPSASGGASDPSYAKLAGNDSYPEVFVGRFSAESAAHVTTQVERTINYELNPVAGEWPHKGTGIASNQGPGHNGGEYDYVHMNYIRNDLLGFTYTAVDQIYDPSASASQVSTALNQGRSFINYTGHGDVTNWSTTGFSNTNVNALTNDGMLPFIVSVACVNGEFDGNTCFGEAWLRATHNGQPTGAIGAYMSSINQRWNPPMDCQDEVTDLLVAQQKTTFGGLCFNGAARMIELNADSGISMYNTWHIFGDPSVQVRTDVPVALDVDHEAIVMFTATDFEVNVTGVEGALCAMYADGILYGSAYTDATGYADIQFGQQLPVGQMITLTVTAFNTATYTAQVQAISPQGPYVIYNASTVDDFVGGNGNSVVDYGESVVMGVQLVNVGPDEAIGVQAAITTDDPYITITDGAEEYGNIPGGFNTVNIADAFAFDVASDIPDGHVIAFNLEVNGTARETWTGTFRLTAHAPALGFVSVAINDAATGNANGKLDPGEDASMVVTINNTGSGLASGVTATLVETDSYVSLYDDAGTFADLAPLTGVSANSGDVFEITADASCGLGHSVTLTLRVSAANGLLVELPFDIIVGDRVNVFADDFSSDLGWTGYGGTGEWTRGPAIGGGTNNGHDPAVDVTPTSDNMVLGNDLTSAGNYNNSISGTQWITSPTMDLTGFHGVQLYFWRFLGVESSQYDHAYLQVYDGAAWVQLYSNPASDFQEDAWSQQYYDVAQYADSNPNFRIRFGLGGSDGSVTYGGWNIDDIVVKGYGHIGTPKCVMSESSIVASMLPNEVKEEKVWVKNNGDGTLRMSFTAPASWLSCTEGDIYIDPADSAELTLVFTSVGMTSGDYSGSLQFVSNDLTQPSGAVPVTMRVSCCQGMVGNLDCDPDDIVSLGDLSALVDHLFISLGPLCCEAEAALDGDPAITLGDLTALIDHLFLSLSPLKSCE